MDATERVTKLKHNLMCSSATNTSANKPSNSFPYKWPFSALFITVVIVSGFYFIPRRCDSCFNDTESYVATESENLQLRNKIESLENELEIKNDIIKSQKELLDWKDELIKAYKDK